MKYLIYMPFMNFYKDRVTFAYYDPTDIDDKYSITNYFERAYYSSDIKNAKKIFRRLEIAPKSSWKNWGLLEMTKEQYNNFKPEYLVDHIGGIISVKQLLDTFNVVEI